MSVSPREREKVYQQSWGQSEFYTQFHVDIFYERSPCVYHKKKETMNENTLDTGLLETYKVSF